MWDFLANWVLPIYGFIVYYKIRKIYTMRKWGDNTMKRFTRWLSAVLAIVLVAGVLFAGVAVGANSGTLDLDGDGKLTIHDAQLAKEADEGTRTLSAEQLQAKGDATLADILYKLIGKTYIMPEIPSTLIANVENENKITQNVANNSIFITQMDSKTEKPSFVFCEGGVPMNGAQWAITGTIRAETGTSSGHIYFAAKKDTSNNANIIVNRNASGVNGIYTNITVDGVRTPEGYTNTLISNDLINTTDWTAQFAFIYYDGTVSLHLKESGEDFKQMVEMDLPWGDCAATFILDRYANVTLSDLQMHSTTSAIQKVFYKMRGIEGDPIDTKHLLFIGNSATSYQGIDVPQILMDLAAEQGYYVDATTIMLGNSQMYHHVDTTTDHGKKVYAEIAKGYEMVFMNDGVGCFLTEASRTATYNASKTLDQWIRAAGGQTGFYVRPPMKKDKEGYNTYQQCVEYDKLFTPLAQELGATNVYANRAFAYAVENYDYNLWKDDDAHPNAAGAYMTACVFYATLFNTSCSVLSDYGLDPVMAADLRYAADQVVFGNYIPE